MNQATYMYLRLKTFKSVEMLRRIMIKPICFFAVDQYGTILYHIRWTINFDTD